ncbi:uncharacterized protein [Watersipora subatra]|uniref:uncharacterized protein n=1 Tax=Watersipora subatra TaxID=2589382 RepID=UPI00355C69A5
MSSFNSRFDSVTLLTTLCLVLLSQQLCAAAIYIGCYSNVIPLAEYKYSETLPNMTVSTCEQRCLMARYRYAALVAPSTCYCGMTYGIHGASDESDCSYRCQTTGEKCGGLDKYSVYDLSHNSLKLAEVRFALEETADSYRFSCTLVLAMRDSLFEVEWTADGKMFNTDTLPQSDLDSVVAYCPTQLLLGKGIVGKTISCSYRGKFRKPELWPFSQRKQAQSSHFLGLEVTDSAGSLVDLSSNIVRLTKGSNEKETYYFRYTVPVKKLAINYTVNQSAIPAACASNEQSFSGVALSGCQLWFDKNNWKERQPLTIKAVDDFIDKDRYVNITLSITERPADRGEQPSDPLDEEDLEDFGTIRALFTNAIQGGITQGSCSIHSHIKTFDGHAYDFEEIGEFVLYRHTNMPIEVHLFFTPCYDSAIPTCVCAVGARVGDDVIILDKCNGFPNIAVFNGTDGVLASGFAIFERFGGIQHEILLPTGGLVTSYGETRYLTITFKASQFDVGQTEGLLGVLNKNASDDEKPQTSSGAFPASWRIPVNETLFYGETSADATTFDLHNYLFPDDESAYLCNCEKQLCNITLAQRCLWPGSGDITQRPENFIHSDQRKFPVSIEWKNPSPRPEFPTRGGITELDARRLCNASIMLDSICESRISREMRVSNCISDIKANELMLLSFRDIFVSGESSELGATSSLYYFEKALILISGLSSET